MLQKKIEVEFGFDKERSAAGGKCPGEESCSPFKMAAGRSSEEKEKNACTNCPKFPTKPKKRGESAADAKTEALIGRVYNLRSELDCGRRLEDLRFTRLEFELLKVESLFRARCRQTAENYSRDLLEQNAVLMQQILPMLAIKRF